MVHGTNSTSDGLSIKKNVEFIYKLIDRIGRFSHHSQVGEQSHIVALIVKLFVEGAVITVDDG